MDLIRKQIEHEQAVQKFTTLFKALHKVPEEEAKQMYELEKFHFMKEIQEKNIPQDVTPLSAAGVFLDVVSNGLSFATSAKHVYLMYRSVKNGDGWEKRLVYSVQPDGKIFQCQKSGAIEYVTKPVMVYEGDDFAPGTNESGNQIIRHTPKFPRQSNKLMAGYVYVVFKGGSREPYWMDMNDVERLKGYSAKNNKNSGANALYTSNNGQIDPGFFGAKLINFALKNVRKSVVPSQYEVEEEPQLPEPPANAQYEVVAEVTPAQTNGLVPHENLPF